MEQFEQVLGMVDKLSVILILAINWMNERRERLELQTRMITRLEALERDKDRDLKTITHGL